MKYINLPTEEGEVGFFLQNMVRLIEHETDKEKCLLTMSDGDGGIILMSKKKLEDKILALPFIGHGTSPTQDNLISSDPSGPLYPVDPEEGEWVLYAKTPKLYVTKYNVTKGANAAPQLTYASRFKTKKLAEEARKIVNARKRFVFYVVRAEQ